MSSTLNEKAERFIEYLIKCKADRGVMADLRCGLSETREHRAWPHIASFCRLDKEFSRTIAQTTAASFSLHPVDCRLGNLGETLKKIAVGVGGQDGLKSFEGRFRRVLACQDTLELCGLIPGIIQAAKSKNVAVNYHQLYLDLHYWNSGRIKLRWAESYWGVEHGISN